MTTLQVIANAAVDEGGTYPWQYVHLMLADDGPSYLAQVNVPSTAGSIPTSWVRLGFDVSALPDGSLVSNVALRLLDAVGYEPFASVALTVEAEYWNGTTWQSFASQALTNAIADYSFGTLALSRESLLAWANGYGMRIRGRRVSGASTALVYIGAAGLTVTYSAPVAPTVTVIEQAVGSGAGGTLVTITGTGFEFNDQPVVSAVTVGGVACTEVTVVSATSLTCRTGAHAAGVVNVVVTNAGGSGTLTNGFTYLSVVDNIVKAVKAGAVVGASAASADLWPSEAAEQVYGSPTELWDTLTIANVNASTFGFVISAVVGTGAVGKIDYAAARFHFALPGLNDPASYLAVLRVADDRQTARPDLYQLPRNGFSVPNDPSIDRRVTAGAEFRMSRRFGPSRFVEKIWHSRELWIDESVQGNTPGLQVFARVDEGAEFQLQDAGGTSATLRGTGPKEVFFPKGDLARGYYMQLIYRVPALAVGQVGAAYAVREGTSHLLCRPKKSWMQDFVLVLSQGAFEDKTSQGLSGAQQLKQLQALVKPGRPAIPFRDPEGVTGYCSVVGLSYKEVVFKEGPKENVLVANVRLRMARYE